MSTDLKLVLSFMFIGEHYLELLNSTFKSTQHLLQFMNILSYKLIR